MTIGCDTTLVSSVWLIFYHG